MSIISRMRRQKAIYWEFLSGDGMGSGTFSQPVEISCRWEDISESFLDRKTGNETLSNSRVFTDREVTIGGFLKLGELDSATPDSPIGVDGANEIRAFLKTPNLRASQTLYEALL
jgi:hypothetical protein